MSTDIDELIEDAKREQYERELGDQMILEFQAERLVSFFDAKPNAAVQMFEMLDEARRVMTVSTRAALILAHGASEVCIQQVLTRGLIYGFVHEEKTADVIADTAIATAKLEGLANLIAHVLQEVAGVAIATEKVGEQELWRTTLAVQRKRHRVAHKGEAATTEEAQHALAVATRWCEGIFPRLLDEMGLWITAEKLIVKQWEPDEEE